MCEVRPGEGGVGDGAPALVGGADGVYLERQRGSGKQEGPRPPPGVGDAEEQGILYQLPQQDSGGGLPRVQGGPPRRGAGSDYTNPAQ